MCELVDVGLEDDHAEVWVKVPAGGDQEDR